MARKGSTGMAPTCRGLRPPALPLTASIRKLIRAASPGGQRLAPRARCRRDPPCPTVRSRMPIASAFRLVMGLGQIGLEPGGQRQASLRPVRARSPKRNRNRTDPLRQSDDAPDMARFRPLAEPDSYAISTKVTGPFHGIRLTRCDRAGMVASAVGPASKKDKERVPASDGCDPDLRPPRSAGPAFRYRIRGGRSMVRNRGNGYLSTGMT